MKILSYLLLTAVLLLASCSNNNKKTDTSALNHIFDLKNIKDTISLSLSNLITDVSFVRIETSDKILISEGDWLVGDKYIVVHERKQGIFQLDKKGGFIRQLTIMGNGPHDTNNALMALNDNNDQLIVYRGRKRSNLLNINLNTGEFLNDIPMNIEAGHICDMYILNDTVITCATIAGSSSNGNGYYFFSQNFSGDLIDTIPIKHRVMAHWNSEHRLIKIGNTLHYRPSNSDTIFTVIHNRFTPDYIFNSDCKGSHDKQKPGDVLFSLVADTKRYFLLRKFVVDKIKPVEGGFATYYSNVGLIYVDKDKNKASTVTSFKNDFTGESSLSNPSPFQSNGYFVQPIQAIKILELIKNAEENEDLKISNREQFIDLKNKIDENDNPILLIGKLK